MPGEARICRSHLVRRGLYLTQQHRRCHQLKTCLGPKASILESMPRSRSLQLQCRRSFFLDSLPTFAVPPVVCTGLLVALWTYKCMMTVMFQDKIIYMPYMPPFARSEKVQDYESVCRPVEWKHQHISSMDGTKIAIGTGTIDLESSSLTRNESDEVVICYFHGNGSSLPPRLPLLSNVLKAIEQDRASRGDQTKYTIVGLSYRGYWTSSGRASQAGIELDAQGLLRWVNQHYVRTARNVQIVLWGQSIGAGIASTAAATYLNKSNDKTAPVAGLILETPFTSIKSMLLGLYPQKWLPYRYLWPFLWNHWDTEVALRRIAEVKRPPKVLLLPATRDEVVPTGEADQLEKLARSLGLDVSRTDIMGALHTEATTRREGQRAVAQFVSQVIKHGAR